jgi:RIO-like serine/threonine protein kinase
LDAQMDARAQSFDAIFRRDVRYVVPVFRRRYAWNTNVNGSPSGATSSRSRSS